MHGVRKALSESQHSKPSLSIPINCLSRPFRKPASLRKPWRDPSARPGRARSPPSALICATAPAANAPRPPVRLHRRVGRHGPHERTTSRTTVRRRCRHRGRQMHRDGGVAKTPRWRLHQRAAQQGAVDGAAGAGVRALDGTERDRHLLVAALLGLQLMTVPGR